MSSLPMTAAPSRTTRTRRSTAAARAPQSRALRADRSLRATDAKSATAPSRAARPETISWASARSPASTATPGQLRRRSRWGVAARNDEHAGEAHQDNAKHAEKPPRSLRAGSVMTREGDGLAYRHRTPSRAARPRRVSDINRFVAVQRGLFT